MVIAAAVVVGSRVQAIDAAVVRPRVLASAIGLKIIDSVHVPIALAVLLGGLILGCFLGRLRNFRVLVAHAPATLLPILHFLAL
jgi:hypothetical protein